MKKTKKKTAKKIGRPRKFKEASVVVSVRIPKSWADALVKNYGTATEGVSKILEGHANLFKAKESIK